MEDADQLLNVSMGEQEDHAHYETTDGLITER